MPDPKSAPYHFVPVVPDLAITDAPVFHDTLGNEGRHSGELRCTMTALTPIICGNYMYQFFQLPENIQKWYRDLLERAKAACGAPHIVNQKCDESVRKDLPCKSVLEPMFAPAHPSNPNEPGPVLIPGSAIKGAIRQSYEALLSAPMERVSERTHSFRPNLADAENIGPAIVVDPQFSSGRLNSLVLDPVNLRCQDLIYITSDAKLALEQFLRQSKVLTGHETLADLDAQSRSVTIRGSIKDLECVDEGWRGWRWAAFHCWKVQYHKGGRCTFNEDFILTRYHGGIDGTNTFAKSFPSGGAKEEYRWMLVRAQAIDKSSRQVPGDALRRYNESLDHLGDSSRGHLRDHPNMREQAAEQAANSIRRFRTLYPKKNDLVFLEYDLDGNIHTIGHHFRFRQSYRDTIHHSPRYAASNAAGISKAYQCLTNTGLRDILCPRPLEMKPQTQGSYQGSPKELTSARRMFGFVTSDLESYKSGKRMNQPLMFSSHQDGNGKNDFSQLAGRIAINWAVEDLGRPKGSPQRFLRINQHHLVPLRALGTPKASAVEHYLRQEQRDLDSRKDGGLLVTYGDNADDLSGELRGRKFYLHQPRAASEPKRYELPLYTPEDLGREELMLMCNKQASLARFVSTRQTTFKFTIRFSNLDAWELGALLFVLTANEATVTGLLENMSVTHDEKRGVGLWLKRAKDKWKPDEQDNKPLLALKLGHGRPLGLGSVQIKIDGFDLLDFSVRDADEIRIKTTPGDRSTFLKAFSVALNAKLGFNVCKWFEKVFTPWLQVHRYAGRSHFVYPLGHQGTTVGYHSDLRQRHARGRRMRRGPVSVAPCGLKSLDSIDEEEAK